MKKEFKYIVLGLAALSVTSCADLDTEPLGSTITTDQKQEAIEAKPELGTAGVTSISSSYNVYMAVSSNHYDFGYPSIMLGMDCHGADLFGGDSGYNWFASWQSYSNPTSNAVPTAMMWYTMYNSIMIENDVIATIDPETTEALPMFYLAQGLANRAFCYWNLANTYQFNYTINPDAPCVPIITEQNRDQVAQEGAPRASVREVYELIMSDLNRAIACLEAGKVDPASVVATKTKRLVTLPAAYGLRARANMSMGKYAEAAADAQAAIANFNGRPYTMEEVSKPGFNNIDDPSWIWGIAIAETDRVVTSGLLNFPSHMCSFAYGYVTVGGWRFCAKDLYDAIPNTDVRKGWWLNEEYTSPNIDAAQQAYLDEYVGNVSYGYNESIYINPYTNVKFDSYKSVLNQTTNASDVPLMRVEEMYLTLAEAKAMSGDVQGGVQTLVDFVTTYRDANYKFAAESAADVQEEVFQQRRIELWGEGLIWFEYMRLNKGVDRRDACAPYAHTYNIPAQDPVLLYLIPAGEITANDQISDDDNNEVGVKPNPVV